MRHPNMRELSNKELADISCDWENPTVDARHCYQIVFKAWETNKEMYEKFKKDGCLVMKVTKENTSMGKELVHPKYFVAI